MSKEIMQGLGAAKIRRANNYHQHLFQYPGLAISCHFCNFYNKASMFSGIQTNITFCLLRPSIFEDYMQQRLQRGHYPTPSTSNTADAVTCVPWALKFLEDCDV